jgi:hypothetical protein
VSFASAAHHQPPITARLAAPLVRAASRAENRSERTVGSYLDSARWVEAFLEGCGKRLEEATQRLVGSRG